MQKILGNKKAYFIFVVPAFIIYLLLAFIPIMMSGYYSTLQWDPCNSFCNRTADPGIIFRTGAGTKDPWRTGIPDNIFYSGVTFYCSDRTAVFENI